MKSNHLSFIDSQSSIPARDEQKRMCAELKEVSRQICKIGQQLRSNAERQNNILEQGENWGNSYQSAVDEGKKLDQKYKALVQRQTELINLLLPQPNNQPSAQQQASPQIGQNAKP